MKNRLIIVAIFFVVSGSVSSDIAVHVEQGLVRSKQKNQLVDLIHNLKKHFDYGHNVDLGQAKKDWMTLSNIAKNLKIFILTDSKTFICLSNKHRQELHLQNVASIKRFKPASKQFNDVFKKVMNLTQIEQNNQVIELDEELGKEIMRGLEDLTLNKNIDNAKNNNDNASIKNDDQGVISQEEVIDDKPGLFAIRVDQKIADNNWYTHSEKKMSELVSLIYNVSRTNVEALFRLNDMCEKNNIIIITDQRSYALCLHDSYLNDIQDIVASCAPAYSHLKVFTPSNEEAKSFKELLPLLQEYSVTWDSLVSTMSRDVLDAFINKQTQAHLNKLEGIVSEHKQELEADEEIRRMISEFHDVEETDDEPVQKSWWNPISWF